MRALLRKLHIRKFRHRLLAAFLLSSVIPILLIGLIAYWQSIAIARENIMGSVRFSSNQVSQSISHRLAQMENVSDSTEYQLYRLTNTPKQPFTQYLDRFVEVRSNITSMVYSFGLFSVNVFVSRDEPISEDGIMFAPLDAISVYGLSVEELWQNQRAAVDWMLLADLEIKRVPYQPGERENILACYRVKRNILRESPEYCYFVTIRCEEIAVLLDSDYEAGQVERYLIDGDGVILAHPDRALIGRQVAPELLLALREDKSEVDGMHLVVNPLSRSDWMLVTTVSDEYMSRNISGLVGILWGATICVLVTVLLAIALLTKGMSRKLHLLSHTMRRYKTEGDTKGLSRISDMVGRAEYARDEFDELAVSFHDMAVRIETDFQEIMHMKLQEEKLNYQVLQSKINPHFLYNILESIKTCQTLGRIHTANEMITKLARFYRHQLGRAGELVPISEELEIGRTYLEIERLCRGELLSWRVEMDDDIENFLICRFSLQPLLENCVQHGFRTAKRPLHIEIAIRYHDEKIVITIADNGCGIPEERLRELRCTLRDKRVDTTRHYGIGNVNARLAMHSANRESCITVDSEPDQGTTIRIEIDQMLD